jgi:prepilin signal peptidase PulO-like enzyme (type II secretory pathway)
VEAITGGFALALFLRFGLSLSFFSFFAFVAAMMVMTFIYLDHRIIPDVISLPGIGIGFFLSFLQPSISVMESLIGLVAGGGTLFVVAWAYEAITKREGMGGGDVKLLARIGAWPSWQPLFFSSSISKPSLGGGDFSPQAFGCFYPFRNNPFRVPDRLFLRGSIGHASWQLRNFGDK